MNGSHTVTIKVTGFYLTEVTTEDYIAIIQDLLSQESLLIFLKKNYQQTSDTPMGSTLILVVLLFTFGLVLRKYFKSSWKISTINTMT